MTLEALLDRLLVPRPNGSDALTATAGFIAETLDGAGADVVLQRFVATPHGLAMAWTASLLLMLAYVLALARGRARVAAALALAVPALLVAEFECLRSPVSGLITAEATNVIGTFPGRPGAPHLVLGAHYDTATHFGDHLVWGAWARCLGPASALAVALCLGLRRRWLPARVRIGLALACVVPYAAMAWCQALGPLVRSPSVGALDNGGSVAVLLRVADRLQRWPAQAPIAVSLAFFAAEEERALGSRAFARALPRDTPTVVVNLESLGAAGDLAWVPEDGFGLRRFATPAWVAALPRAAARALGAPALPAQALPFGTLTDGRSFLAEGIPAVTLRGRSDAHFPRGLHSWRDSRDRLDLDALEQATTLLVALVRHAAADPARLAPPVAMPDERDIRR